VMRSEVGSRYTHHNVSNERAKGVEMASQGLSGRVYYQCWRLMFGAW